MMEGIFFFMGVFFFSSQEVLARAMDFLFFFFQGESILFFESIERKNG